MAMTTIDERPRIAYPERQELLQTLAETIGRWLRHSRTRRSLRALETHRLTDVGLSERQRDAECRKWFWQT